MNLRSVGVLSPSEGVADFPTFARGSEAGSLWACWTAAWRPGLIAATGGLPTVVPAYGPPPAGEWADGLLLVPTAPTDESAEWLDAVRGAQAPTPLIVEGLVGRDQVIAAAQQLLAAAAPGIRHAPAELDAEFYALGYAYLQVEMLTHDLAGGSVFDPTLFSCDVVEAARHAVDGDARATHDHLRWCYDQLEQARSHTYPLELLMLDALLVAETTLGDSLVRTLAETRAANVLLPGDIATRLADACPAARDALQTAVQDGRACVMTGAYGGIDLAAAPPEAARHAVEQSLEAATRAAGVRPEFFARHATAAPPRLPQMLKALGFRGALLAGFDGAAPPPLDQGRTTWVGLDGSALEAVAGTPADLAQAETVLSLHERLAETWQRDPTPTLVLAGWPGGSHPAVDDLRLVTQRSGVLGRFVTLDAYFDRAAAADHWSTITGDQLGRGPAAGAAAKPPAAAAHDALLDGLAYLATPPNEAKAAGVQAGGTPHQPAAPEHDGLPREATLLRAIGAGPPNDGASATGNVAFNAWSFARPTAAPVPTEAPACGFCWLPTDLEQHGPDAAAPPTPPRAEGHTLRSESLEARLHPETGGLQALRRHGVRANRVSQRLFAVSARGATMPAEMRAEAIDVVQASGDCGAIRSRGAIVGAGGRELARFEQAITLPAGASHAVFAVRVEATALLGERERIALRLNVGPGEWRLHRGLQWARLPVHTASFLVGDYLELGQGQRRVTVAPDRPGAGRRRGAGVIELDARLGEACRYAVAIDEPLPMRLALAAFGGPLQAPAAAPPAAGRSGWWLHADAGNVQVSAIAPGPPGEGGHRRVRLRLIETEGRAATTRVRLWRPIRSAKVCGQAASTQGAAAGSTQGGHAASAYDEELAVEQGAAVVEIGPYGWLELEAAW